MNNPRGKIKLWKYRGSRKGSVRSWVRFLIAASTLSCQLLKANQMKAFKQISQNIHLI